MKDYGETNFREFKSYVYKLGTQFSMRFSGPGCHRAWLDVGSGYGVAALEKLADESVGYVTLINAQDSWGYVTSAQAFEDLKARKVATALALVLKLDLNPYPPAESVTVRWATLRSQLHGTFDRFRRSGQLSYRVGRAEKELPKLKKRYEILTDVFGAYFYSADRLALLDEYYRLLSRGGEAFILFRADEPKPSLRADEINPDREIFGPATLLEDRAFEKVLVEMFPSIFHILTVEDGIGRYRALHIVRDASVGRLGLVDDFEIVSANLNADHESSVQSEVPQVVIRRKKF